MRSPADPILAGRLDRESALGTLSGGLRELAGLPDLAASLGRFWVPAFVRGIFNVLVVSLTLTTLGLGEGAVGFISGTFGAGVVVGALGATSMVGMRRLGRRWRRPGRLGLPLIVIALRPGLVIKMVAFVVSGIGNAVLDVVGLHADAAHRRRPRAGPRVRRVLRRHSRVDRDRLDRRPGTDRRGRDQRSAGARQHALPAVALLIYPRLRRIDGCASVPEAALSSVVAVPLLEPLPPTSLEKLARAALRRLFQQEGEW